ncbi:galactose-3-O-sulfotransferase 2 [Gallus gallus]|uniref:Galactose-3-O-sulfotransferase 4 n=1 Tax=Gallus gallus TaxID=9031 RepID=A0A8V1A1Q3_CHICK|nr:galactose-3-O-sulfotransferase 2 [Gallus gallus]
MLKFRRYLITNLKAIYRCQPGRLWVSFSLLILLMVSFQVVEKLQPTRNCHCELERALQQTTDHSQESPDYVLQTHIPPREDDHPYRQRKAVLEPAENTQDGFQMHLYYRQVTPRESSPDRQERHWAWQPTENSNKMKAYLSAQQLKSQLSSPRKATRGDIFPGVPESAATALGDTADGVLFTSSIAAEEHKKTTSPQMMGVTLQSPPQHQAMGSPPRPWVDSVKHTVLGTAQLLRADDFYRTELERGLLPSWAEISTDEMALGDGGQVEDVFFQKVCKPKTNIVFLKVHKSASSTVMNILFRFGEMHNLTFAFPLRGGHQLFYPHHFMARFVQGFSPGKPPQFNILCHHMRFLRPEVQKVVPSTAVYFSILRNPVQLMESSFVYYKGTSAFSRARSLEEFLSQPYRFYNPTAGDSHYARNLMTFDFGFNPDAQVTAKRVNLMLRAIEASFDLLLISEYFDESMVLLKETLCWDLDSVVSFPLNSRDSSTRSPLSSITAEKIKAWNRLDWEIYTHFNRTFWERVERDIGRERLWREVRALRQRRAELARTCLQGTGSVGPKDIKDSSLRPLQYGNARILGYNIKQGLDEATEHMCRRLVTPELQYSTALYKKQFPPNPPQNTPQRPLQKPPQLTPSLQGMQQGKALRYRLKGTRH